MADSNAELFAERVLRMDDVLSPTTPTTTTTTSSAARSIGGGPRYGSFPERSPPRIEITNDLKPSTSLSTAERSRSPPPPPLQTGPTSTFLDREGGIDQRTGELKVPSERAVLLTPKVGDLAKQRGERADEEAYIKSRKLGIMWIMNRCAELVGRKHELQFTFFVVLNLIQVAVATLMTLAIQFIIDSIIPNQDKPKAFTAIGVLAGCFLIYSIVIPLRVYIGNHLAIEAVRHLRLRLLESVQLLPPSHMITRPNVEGELTSYFSSDMQSIETTVFLFTDYCAFVIALLGPLGVSLYFNLILGPVALILIFFTTIMPKPLGNLSSRESTHAQNSNADMLALFQELVLGWNEIRLFRLQDRMRKRFAPLLDSYCHHAFRTQLYGRLYYSISYALGIGVRNVILVGIGALLVIRGQFSVGSFTALYISVGLFANAFERALSIVIQLLRGAGSIDRVLAFLKESDKIIVAESLRARQQQQSFYQLQQQQQQQQQHQHQQQEQVFTRRFKKPPEVEMRHVFFAYPTMPSRPVLEDFSLTVPSGRSMFIVGRSGSGKSTLAKLILGYFRPQRGTITFDGEEFDFEAMQRANVGVVMQDTFIFKDTIFENIRLSRPDATFEEVQEAAKMAGIHWDVSRMLDQYMTQVDNKSLSGGQKQRIGIARAMLRNPYLLILDEAFSALDKRTAMGICKTLKKQYHNRTVISITHDPNTIDHDGLVMLMKEGKVRIEGPYKEVMPYLEKNLFKA